MEADEQVVDVAINMNISRGEKKENDIDFTKVENYYVFDELGNKVRFGDLYKDHKCIIIFSRVSVCACFGFLTTADMPTPVCPRYFNSIFPHILSKIRGRKLPDTKWKFYVLIWK